MSTEQELLVQEYAKNPLCNYKMDDYTVTSHEGNFICWDDIDIYLIIENGIVKKYSFDGNCSNITTAAASFLSEFIVWITIDEVLNWKLDFFVDRWFDVSKKRRRALVIWLMAVRNAIHNYLNDWKKDNFDDLLE
jgi:NifU-like protein involved in Fe-S cluster formation